MELEEEAKLAKRQARVAEKKAESAERQARVAEREHDRAEKELDRAKAKTAALTAKVKQSRQQVTITSYWRERISQIQTVEELQDLIKDRWRMINPADRSGPGALDGLRAALQVAGMASADIEQFIEEEKPIAI
jgi:hypothetical protein